MQYLDNNIDELFIKAADEYAPKMHDDWEAIESLLQDDTISVVNRFSLLKGAITLFIISVLSTTVIELKDAKLIAVSNRETKNTVKIQTESVVTNNQSKIIDKIGRRVKIINSKDFTTKTAVTYNTLPGKSFLLKTNQTIFNTDLQSGIENGAKENGFPQSTKDDISVVEKNIFPNISANNIETVKPEKEADLEIVNTSITNKSVNSESKKDHKLYFGLQTGIAYNQVRSQGFTKPGYNIGVIAGFAFNKRWALESGVLLTKKSYYSSGQYFNDTKAASNMPAGMIVKSLEGNCTLLEVPLTLKYNLPDKKNNRNFYTSAGLITNIITNEHNNYQASLNGGLPQHLEATYTNNDFKILSSLNIALGYENKISKKIIIRIEPYLQIPLKGIGIGALPVSTVGLHFGFSNNH